MAFGHGHIVLPPRNVLEMMMNTYWPPSKWDRQWDRRTNRGVALCTLSQGWGMIKKFFSHKIKMYHYLRDNGEGLWSEGCGTAGLRIISDEDRTMGFGTGGSSLRVG